LGCSGISWTTLLQIDNHTNTSSLNFYSLDALPDAQPTALNAANEHTQMFVASFCYYIAYVTKQYIKQQLAIVCWNGFHDADIKIL